MNSLRHLARSRNRPARALEDAEDDHFRAARASSAPLLPARSEVAFISLEDAEKRALLLAPFGHALADKAQIAAGEPMLATKPLEHPFGRMSLLAVPTPVVDEPGVNDLRETIQLRAPDRRRASIPRRNREAQHLPDAVA